MTTHGATPRQARFINRNHPRRRTCAAGPDTWAFETHGVAEEATVSWRWTQYRCRRARRRDERGINHSCPAAVNDMRLLAFGTSNGDTAGALRRPSLCSPMRLPIPETGPILHPFGATLLLQFSPLQTSQRLVDPPR